MASQPDDATKPLIHEPSGPQIATGWKPRIAICTAHFHPTLGGSERQMFQLAERFADRGHQPLVLTRRMPGLAARETLHGIEIRRAIRTVSLGPMFGASFIASLASLLIRWRHRYDVVLCAQIPWEAVASGLVCTRLAKPSLVIAASTGPRGDVRQLREAKGSRLWRKLVLRNQLFLALSTQARDELEELGCAPARIRRITNGVDLQKFQPCTEPDLKRARTVVCVARLTAAKTPEFLLRAWRQVNASGRFHLLMVGSGDLGESLKAQSQRDGLVNVEFLGDCIDVPAIHRRACIFVLPSPSEGCSNALLEAMASGLCPVVTRVPGNVDLVTHGLNGLLVTHGEDHELAAALLRVLEDENLRRDLGQAARLHVERHHDLQKIASQFLGLFQDLKACVGRQNLQQ